MHRVTINDKPVTIRTNVSGGSITSAGGTSRFKAGGGTVTRGQAYWVGEKEPEVFVPDAGGTILNRKQLARVGGGGGNTTVIQQFSFPNYVGNRDELVRELKTAHDRGALRRIGIAT